MLSVLSFEMSANLVLQGVGGVLSVYIVQRMTNAFFLSVAEETVNPPSISNVGHLLRVWSEELIAFTNRNFLSRTRVLNNDLIRNIRISTVIAAVAILFQHQGKTSLFVYIPLLWFVIPFAFVDATYRLLPVFVINKLTLIGLALSFSGLTVSPLTSFLGMLGSASFLIALNYGYKKSRGYNGIESTLNGS
jgi:hypothetical protein